jgi:nucleotide-binding universal stress UspA family protein
MKNILVPIDFSSCSVSASKMGAYLAKKTGATLHLLHVANIPVGWANQSLKERQKNPVLEKRFVNAEIKLKKFSKSPIFKNITVTTTVKGEVPFEQILSFAKAPFTHLIVMGAHGAGETARLFIGSTAQRVLRMAHCPVLSVKKNYIPKDIRRIVFASDFEGNISRPVNTVKNLAATLKASIDLLYVKTPTRLKDSEELATRMKAEVHVQKQVPFNCVVYHDKEIETGVNNYAKKSKAGMIALVTNLRKRKAGYHLGVAETILFHTNVPVLSFVQK